MGRSLQQRIFGARKRSNTPPEPVADVVADHDYIDLALTGDHGRANARTTRTEFPDPASVMAPAGTHNLPRAPAEVFVGRDTALGQVARGLEAKAAAVVTQAIYGLGGVGKSELALQHAHASLAVYTLTWWITSEDPAGIQSGLADLAGTLCQEIKSAATTTDAAEWALSWLKAHQGWLLVLDNVTEPADIQPLRAQLNSGHILITTRRDIGWNRVADLIGLDILDSGSACAFLVTRTGQHDQASENAAALIADELGFLPLALDQAAAYITQARITLPDYLGLLRQQPADLYEASSGHAQQTVARTWDVTFQAVRAGDPAAISLLEILACYAPDRLPRAILGGKADPDRLVTNKALALVASYSLIALTADDVSMHRLVQAVLRLRHSRHTDAIFGGASPLVTALQWLNDSLPSDPQHDVEAWPLLRALVPHAEHLAAHFPANEEPLVLGRIQNTLGLYLCSQAKYARALELYNSALRIMRTSLGPEHPKTAAVLGNLAVTYQMMGRYADALPLAERALAVAEAALGPGHPSTAIGLGNLAVTYCYLGRYADALPHMERALAVTEAAAGPDHPSTVNRRGNLALTYRKLGRHADALPLAERALAVAEAALGPDHPSTAIPLGTLAATYNDLGRHADALPLEERALAVTEAALGPGHPDTAARLGNLALTYRKLGRHADALPLEERALAVTEAALGPGHPDTAARLGDLALTYRKLGRHADALPLAELALAVTEAALGPGHPDTAARLGDLALTYRKLGRHADALPLAERAVAVAEAALGPGHPSTAIGLGTLALSYSKLGRHADALPLEERALAITEAAFGPDHPMTAVRLGNLAVIYCGVGRHNEALPLQERAVAITEAALGPEHPDTALLLGNLALTYRKLGRHADVRPLQERALAIADAALGPDHPQTAWIRRKMAAASTTDADAMPE